MPRLSVAVLVALSLTARQATAQAPPSLLDSYTRAKALIDRAVDVHGGAAMLDAIRQARVVYAGWDYHPTQGRRPTGPRDSTARRFELAVDLAARRLIAEQQTGWPGGFRYVTRFVTRGDTGYNIAPRWGRHSVHTTWDPPERQFGNLFRLPLWYLATAHQSASQGQRRSLGQLRAGGPGGVVVEAVHVPLPNGGSTLLGFDPASGELRAAMSVGTDVFTGETEVWTEFREWRQAGGLRLPHEVVVRRGGEVIQRLTLQDAEDGHRIADALTRPPAGSVTVAPVPTEPVVLLAPGVWLVGTGSRTLLVDLGDHLVAIDAPSSTSSETIRRAAELAPGKPIRYVVPTHHHDDHFVGVRYHVANGAAVVTTPGNLDYLRRVLAAPMSSLMLASNQVPPTSDYRVEVVEGDLRVFEGGGRRVELHRIASPHAEEMLVAWLPGEGILFQADLIEAPPEGVALPGNNAEATMHLAGVIRRRGWTVRQFAGAHATLRDPAEFSAITGQAIVP